MHSASSVVPPPLQPNPPLVMRAASTHDPRSELRSRARGRRSALSSKGILAGAASGFCLYSTSCRAGCCSAPWWSHGHVFYTHGPEMTVFRTVFCRYDSACEKLPLKCPGTSSKVSTRVACFLFARRNTLQGMFPAHTLFLQYIGSRHVTGREKEALGI